MTDEQILAMTKLNLQLAGSAFDSYLSELTITAAKKAIAQEGITLDLNAKTATCDGRELVFTKLEFELLSFFLQHPGISDSGQSGGPGV